MDAPDEPNPYETPAIPQRNEDSVRPAFSPIDEYQPPEDDGFHIPLRGAMGLGLGPALAWAALRLWYPRAWAIVTAFMVIMVFGLLTTRFVFRFESRVQVWGLAPLFGAAWFLLLWLLLTFVV